MTLPIQWNEAAAAVEAAAAILVVTHVSPDGDAIGSLLGLSNALRERAKNVTAAVDGGVPATFNFLQGSDTVQDKLHSGDWELMISVDASDEARSGLVGAYGRAHSKTVINLDHHETNTGFGDIFLVMPEAVSATEVIFHWLKAMAHPLSPAVAACLMTGLLTDTISFRTNNVRPSTFAVAQSLMEAGAPVHEITQRVLDSRSYNGLLLWREALPSVSLEGKVVSAAVTQENLKTAGLKDLTDAGLVGLLNSVHDAVIAVVFKETAEGRIELSMRARTGLDVGQIAVSLGGGGHKVAAGATIDGPLQAAKARVLPLLLQEAAKNGGVKP